MKNQALVAHTLPIRLVVVFGAGHWRSPLPTRRNARGASLSRQWGTSGGTAVCLDGDVTGATKREQCDESGGLHAFPYDPSIPSLPTQVDDDRSQCDHSNNHTDHAPRCA